MACMSATGIIDRYLEDFSKRLSENEFLLISASDVIDILLDVRSSLDLPELVVDGDEITKLVHSYVEKRVEKLNEAQQ